MGHSLFLPCFVGSSLFFKVLEMPGLVFMCWPWNVCCVEGRWFLEVLHADGFH